MSRAWVWVLLVTGCGGSCPEAASASSTTTREDATVSSSGGETAEGPGTEAEGDPKKPEAGGGKAEPAHAATSEPDATAEPTFPENASVSQAIAAIPKGTTRANIDEETLGTPLQSEALYAPCKVGTQHFKLRVAVWNGHAVGVDVTTPNKALASCIDARVRGVEWRDKVRSLNTVDYSM